ncbi:MAG: phosphohistidine phosphatase SixA [Pseudomonadota bacterium]
MKLWLLRHGEAESEFQASSDAARALTPHGRQEVQHSAARLQGQDLTAILVSPYVRAQQTAELVRQVLGFAGAIETVPWLTPDSDPRQVLRQLDKRGGASVLLVTHQPLVGQLVGILLHGHRQSPVPMHTASLAELEGEMPFAGLMNLRGLYHPSV